MTQTAEQLKYFIQVKSDWEKNKYYVLFFVFFDLLAGVHLYTGVHVWSSECRCACVYKCGYMWRCTCMCRCGDVCRCMCVQVNVHLPVLFIRHHPPCVSDMVFLSLTNISLILLGELPKQTQRSAYLHLSSSAIRRTHQYKI